MIENAGGKMRENTDLKKIKNTIKFIDIMLASGLNPIETKAYCAGYVLAMGVYTDIGTDAVFALNQYIRERGKK